MRVGPIALMTDFGEDDPFVGIMKGVILGINPSAALIDLCHGIRLGNVYSAAFALWMSLPYMPKGTILAAVIDPGVGSARRIIAADIDDHTVVCPDNGILSWVLRDKPLKRAVEVNNTKFFLPQVSNTFHGRDIFGPVAAHLSMGKPLEEFGPAIDDPVVLSIPEVVKCNQSLQGEVVYIDQFGNLLTNITREVFDAWHRQSASEFRIHLGSLDIPGLCGSYADRPAGHPLALFGSADVLEIAVSRGNAAEAVSAVVGSPVLIYAVPDFGNGG